MARVAVSFFYFAKKIRRLLLGANRHNGCNKPRLFKGKLGCTAPSRRFIFLQSTAPLAKNGRRPKPAAPKRCYISPHEPLQKGNKNIHYIIALPQSNSNQKCLNLHIFHAFLRPKAPFACPLNTPHRKKLLQLPPNYTIILVRIRCFFPGCKA